MEKSVLVHVGKPEDGLVHDALDLLVWEALFALFHELVNVLLHELKNEVKVVIDADHLL